MFWHVLHLFITVVIYLCNEFSSCKGILIAKLLKAHIFIKLLHWNRKKCWFKVCLDLQWKEAQLKTSTGSVHPSLHRHLWFGLNLVPSILESSRECRLRAAKRKQTLVHNLISVYWKIHYCYKKINTKVHNDASFWAKKKVPHKFWVFDFKF